MFPNFVSILIILKQMLKPTGFDKIGQQIQQGRQRVTVGMECTCKEQVKRQGRCKIRSAFKVTNKSADTSNKPSKVTSKHIFDSCLCKHKKGSLLQAAQITDLSKKD